MVTALLQGTLLVMGISFEYISPPKKENGIDPIETATPELYENGDEPDSAEDTRDQASEQTPLLRHS